MHISLTREQDKFSRRAHTIPALAEKSGPGTGGNIRRFARVILGSVWLLAASGAALAQTEVAARPQTAVAALALPDAPDPQTPAASPVPKVRPMKPCPAPNEPPGIRLAPCAPPHENWYQHFVRGPRENQLTPKDKAWLAARNIVDPFNAITILGEAAISVGSDSHSPYGPGMSGYGRYVGVSYCQDLTGEFFGTFLIPSVTHQDPHYHRLDKAGIPRRITHAIIQVVWTRSDTGHGMPNYANLAGFAIDDQISNLYVPGRETSAEATASRYAIGIATAPIGNFITEFVPDVARHIHVQIVIIQRVINQVARNEAGGGSNP